MLPDDVLLEIFDFYVDEDMNKVFERIEEWITLVHVCRRWRSVVFQSPRRLNMRLLCKPARDTLDIWPPLPLVICVFVVDVDDICDAKPPGADNMIAALGHNDRVCQIQLDCLPRSQMGCHGFGSNAKAFPRADRSAPRRISRRTELPHFYPT
jgi:F-box-like